jgi:outer membrane protein
MTPGMDTIGGPILTLKQAVDISLKNNLVVNQADLQSQTNKVQYDQAWGNMLPNISGSASQQIGFGRTLNSYDYTYVNQVNTGNYGVSGSIVLFNGLQLLHNLQANNYAYGASKFDLQQQKDNITLNVILAYLLVLSSQDQLTILREQAEIDKRQVDRLDTLNNSGALLLLSNLSDLQGQYAGDQVNIAAAVNSLEAAKVSLFQLMNVSYRRDLQYENSVATTLSISEYQQSADSVYRTALDIYPSIKSVDLRLKAYQKFLQAVKGQYYPSLSFGGGISTNFSSLAFKTIPLGIDPAHNTGSYVLNGGVKSPVLDTTQLSRNEKISWGDQFTQNKNSYIGFQLNIPILNNLRARNNVRIAKINLKNAQLNATNARLALQQNVELAFQSMQAAYKQYKFFMDQVAAFTESFRTTEIRFNEGVVNSDVYVIAKNNVDRANTNLAAAKYTYIFRTKVMDYYQGKLTP